MIADLQAAWLKWQTPRLVRRHGFRSVAVGEYESPEPNWAYTVGFWESVQAPEVIVFDVTVEAAASLLWSAYSDLKSGELTLRDGQAWEGFEGFLSVWRRVHPSRIDDTDNWFALARWYRGKKTRREDLQALQLVLPDAAGAFPWEPAYDERLRHLQPALYLPAAV